MNQAKYIARAILEHERAEQYLAFLIESLRKHNPFLDFRDLIRMLYNLQRKLKEFAAYLKSNGVDPNLKPNSYKEGLQVLLTLANILHNHDELGEDFTLKAVTSGKRRPFLETEPYFLTFHRALTYLKRHNKKAYRKFKLIEQEELAIIDENHPEKNYQLFFATKRWYKQMLPEILPVALKQAKKRKRQQSLIEQIELKQVEERIPLAKKLHDLLEDILNLAKAIEREKKTLKEKLQALESKRKVVATFEKKVQEELEKLKRYLSTSPFNKTINALEQNTHYAIAALELTLNDFNQLLEMLKPVLTARNWSKLQAFKLQELYKRVFTKTSPISEQYYHELLADMHKIHEELEDLKHRAGYESHADTIEAQLNQ